MKDLNKIFELANLEASSDSEIKKDFEKIVKWIDKLKEVKTEDIETPEVFSRIMLLREDNVLKFENIKGIYSNIPERDNNFFVVPQVVKNE